MAIPTSLPRWLALLAVFACTSSSFGAQSVTIDFSNRGISWTAKFREGVLTATPELNLPLLHLRIWNGLGVADTLIDPGESVLFALDLPATGVSYAVQTANDTDGDGHLGETEVEGYGAGGEWLGTVEIYGLTSRDISTPFSNQPLSAIRVRPSEPIRISSLSYNSGSPVTVNFDNRGISWTAKFRTSGLTVTPELNLPLLHLRIWNGLGVADTLIDPGESVLFALDLPATGVSYAVQTANDTDGDGHLGETEVEGYGAGGEWLGTVEIYGLTSRDISTPFSNQPLSAIRVRPSEPIRISSLSFNAARKTRPPQTQIVE